MFLSKFISKRFLTVVLSLSITTALFGFNPQVNAASSTADNEFTLDVIQEVIGLEVTVTSVEGNYLGQYASIETEDTTIRRNLSVKNIGNVDLKVTGYSDEVTKNGVVYNNQSSFDVKYNYNGTKYASSKNGFGITKATVLNTRLGKGLTYDSSLDFVINNQVEEGQYKFAFYHIGEYAGKL